MNFITISFFHLAISDLAQGAERLISHGLESPSFFTLILVFSSGLLTSLGPCSLSLLPVTVAYLAGFNEGQRPLVKSLIFCSGIVLSLVFIGSLSGFLGKIYGQLPYEIGIIVPIVTILMGLNLLGIFKLALPAGPNPNIFREKVPEPFAPFAAGMMFGLVASPCTTPVLAVLLAWIAQHGNPFSGLVLLACFGSGQVIPLFLAGTTAASIPRLLSMRKFSQWIPALSGVIFLTTGVLSFLARWT